MRKALVGAAVAAALTLGLGSSVALAGEVKGPPGTENNTNETAAPDHANSACAFSGLNDLDGSEGQNESIVQTAADSWRYYGLPHGTPGTLGTDEDGNQIPGLCRGGADGEPD